MIYAQKGMLVRVIYLLISLAIWLLKLGGRFAGSRKIILCYHGITAANVAAFSQQMHAIADRVVALESDHAHEEKWFSHPSVVLTFDDAFENILENMLPIIEELHIPVSVYVVTSCLGKRPNWLIDSGHYDEHEPVMSVNQVKELSKNPLVTIGSHTRTHPRLTDIPRDDVEVELSESRQFLESLIGRKVSALAYPHGAYNLEVSEIAASCGFTKMLTLEEEMINSRRVNGDMGRFIMEPDVWPIEFRLTVDGAYSWLYGFRRAIKFCRTIARR